MSNREESVIGYINFMYYDTSMARCNNSIGIMTKKAHSDLHICLDIKWYTLLSLPFYQILNIERNGNCRSRNLTNKFCTGVHFYVSRMLADRAEDAFVAMCFSLSSCLDVREWIATYMKLTYSTVSVCLNYSTSLRNDNFSSFKRNVHKNQP